DAEPGQPQHWKVIGAISDCDHLLHAEVLVARDFLKQRRLARAIDDRALHFAGDEAVANVEFVRMHEVDAQSALQLMTYESETSGEYGCLVSQPAKRRRQAFCSVHQLNAVDDGSEGALWKAP